MRKNIDPAGRGRRARRPAFLLFAVALSIIFSVSAFAAERDEPIFEFEQLSGKRIGILVGTILDKAVEQRVDYTLFDYYDDYNEMEKDLLKGAIDAIVGDYPVLLQIAAYVPGLRVLDEWLEDGYYGLAFRSADVWLRNSANRVIADMRRDGSLDKLVEKWVTGPEAEKVIPPVESDDRLPRLRVGTSSVMPPFSYLNGEKSVVGLDLELSGIIASRIGRRLDVYDMEFGSLIPSLLDGEIDMIASCLSITPEREKIIRFTDGYYLNGIGILVRK